MNEFQELKYNEMTGQVVCNEDAYLVAEMVGVAEGEMDTYGKLFAKSPKMLALLREIVPPDPQKEYGWCYYCRVDLTYQGHRRDCPITRAREIIEEVEGK